MASNQPYLTYMAQMEKNLNWSSMQVCFLNSERKKLIQFQMYVGNSYNAWEKNNKK